jgi:hypothetical protein
MNPALNREASEARTADLRRLAGRDAIAVTAMRAGREESASPLASLTRKLRQSLHSRPIGRPLPRVLAAGRVLSNRSELVHRLRWQRRQAER